MVVGSSESCSNCIFFDSGGVWNVATVHWPSFLMHTGCGLMKSRDHSCRGMAAREWMPTFELLP